MAGSGNGLEPGLGLYSVRALFESDPRRTLESVAGMGFARVEPYAIADHAITLAALLPAIGLTAPVVHAGPRGLPEERFFAGAAAIGAQTVIIPGSDPDLWTTRSGIDAFLAELWTLSEQAHAYGLRLGYHNHDFEARTLVADEPALEYFAQSMPPQLILEIDVYWLERGGISAAPFLTAHAERVPFLHIKDAAPNRNGTLGTDQRPAGEGVLPWQSILSAATSLEMAVIEFDEYDGDILLACRRALLYLRDLSAPLVT